MKKKEVEMREAPRVSIETKVEFIIEADIIKARSVDISDTGVRFETDKPITIRLRMEVDGKIREQAAQLVWAKTGEDGMIYGFKYVKNAKEPFESF